MIKWGIIGWGSIAKRFAASLEKSSDGTLYAIGTRTGVIDEVPGEILLYREYRQLINDVEVDAIYIALPHKFHKEWTLAALNMGKAVLCEKPASLNTADFDEMSVVARRNGVFLMEAMKTPFIPLIPVIRKRLDEGVVGNVTSVYSCFCVNVLNHIPTGHYLLDPEQGGSLLDMGPYPLAFLIYMCGLEIEKVAGSLTMHGDVDSSFQAELLFSNGIKGIAEGSICEDKPRCAYIEGTLGTMEIPMSNRPEEYKIIYNDGRMVSEKMPIQGDDMLGEIEEVHHCIRDEKLESPQWNWDYTRKVLSIMDMLRKN